MRLIVIVGPTAVGKTRIAVECAQRLGSEIVSVDARQVYRGLDLGTGKDLHLYHRADITVHLVDVADVHETYSLFRFLTDARALLSELRERPPFSTGTPLIIAGGSGLYLEALLSGYRLADVPADWELRQQLASAPLEELVDELRVRSPDLYSTIDRSEKRRVIRGLEIARYAEIGDVSYCEPQPFALEPLIYGIDVPREIRRRWISDRLLERLEQGMVEEVRDLIAAGVTFARLNELGLEYREVGRFLGGEKAYAEMVEDLTTAIRRFAKRQDTWFRGMSRRGADIQWLSPEDAVDRILSAAATCWMKSS